MIRSFRCDYPLVRGVLLAAFLLFGLFLHSVLARALEHRLDETLSVEAKTDAALLADEFVEEGRPRARCLRGAGRTAVNGSTVTILAGDRVLAASAPVPPDELAEIAARAPPIAGRTLSWRSRGRAERRSRRGRSHHARRQDFLCWRPASGRVVADLAVLRSVLLLALPLLIGLAGIGGYWLTSRSLAPLASMAEQARRITHSNLETRLDDRHGRRGVDRPGRLVQ